MFCQGSVRNAKTPAWSPFSNSILSTISCSLASAIRPNPLRAAYLRVTDSSSSRCPLREPRLWEAERPPTVPSLRFRSHLKVTAVPVPVPVPVRAERTRERNCSSGAVRGCHPPVHGSQTSVRCPQSPTGRGLLKPPELLRACSLTPRRKTRLARRGSASRPVEGGGGCRFQPAGNWRGRVASWQ